MKWWQGCIALGLVFGIATLGALGVWRIDRYLDERVADCYMTFDGNVAGRFCPVAEFRERPPVRP